MSGGATTVLKTAQVGTQMLRLADVRSAAQKIKTYSVRALRLAEAEGRDDDRELCLAKVRTATAVLQELLDGCPVFINAQVIEARQGGNGAAGAVHESAVGHADAPTIQHLTTQGTPNG